MKKTYLPLCFVYAILGYALMKLSHVTVPLKTMPLQTLTDSLDSVEPSCEDDLIFDWDTPETEPIDEFAHVVPEEYFVEEQPGNTSEFIINSSIITTFNEVTLKWIATQQKSDGGWETCLTAEQKKITPRLGRNGATALALWCLLESGYTHKERRSQYKNQVLRGLLYLTYHDDPEQRDLTDIRYSYEDAEGRMISHALATVAICEAYGATKDKALLPYAQGCLNYIAKQQDPRSGGWALDRKAAPDLITTGWIVQSLHKGAMAGLKIDPAVIKLLNAYVERTKPTAANRLSPQETSLWCQIVINLGATRATPGLADGVRALDSLGFSREDSAYNFFAYSVMRRWDDETQRRWFEARRMLAEEGRETHGPNKGSWPPVAAWGKQNFWNSRLERTCLMYLACHLESGSSWRHWHLKDGPEDESFPL